GAHELLHDPVLERVEADDRPPPPGAEQLECRRKRRLERAELVVHGDPERLEDAPGRMAVAEARRRRDRALDRADEVGGALVRLLAPAPRDRAGDLPRVALLAVALEDLRELALRELVEEVARLELRRRIHGHVVPPHGGIGVAALGQVVWL